MQERPAARVAARATPLAEQDLATVKEKLHKLQAELLASEQLRAAAKC